MPSVASAATCAPRASLSEASGSSRGTTEASVIDRIMSTVPPTTGVTMRRRMNSHLEMAIWPMPQTMTRAARVAGPPPETASMQKGMEKAAVNMGSIAPAPITPTRRTCIIVVRPATSRDAKTTHTRYESSRPDALATTTGVTKQRGRRNQAELGAITKGGKERRTLMRFVARLLLGWSRQSRLPIAPLCRRTHVVHRRSSYTLPQSELADLSYRLRAWEYCGWEPTSETPDWRDGRRSCWTSDPPARAATVTGASPTGRPGTPGRSRVSGRCPRRSRARL